MTEPDPVPRVVLTSRAIVFGVVWVLIVMLAPEVMTEAWPWIGLVASVAIGYPLIVHMVRRAEPSSRARALRRANLLVTPLCAAVVIPLVSLLRPVEIGVLPSLALGAGVLALLGALFADLASFLLPESWRDLDRPRGLWAPSRRTITRIALAWLPGTALLFWLVTGMTGDGGCVVDSTCKFGVPFTFMHFGERSGWRMDWADFCRDVCIFATVIPAIYGVATSRLRVFFAIHLVLVGALVSTTADWSSESSMRVWMEVDLLGR